MRLQLLQRLEQHKTKKKLPLRIKIAEMYLCDKWLRIITKINGKRKTLDMTAETFDKVVAELTSSDMADIKEIGSVNDLVGIAICFLGQKWNIKFRELEMRKYLVEYHKLFLWYETPISVHKKYFLALVKAKQNGRKIIPALAKAIEIK